MTRLDSQILFCINSYGVPRRAFDVCKASYQGGSRQGESASQSEFPAEQSEVFVVLRVENSRKESSRAVLTTLNSITKV